MYIHIDTIICSLYSVKLNMSSVKLTGFTVNAVGDVDGAVI